MKLSQKWSMLVSAIALSFSLNATPAQACGGPCPEPEKPEAPEQPDKPEQPEQPEQPEEPEPRIPRERDNDPRPRPEPNPPQTLTRDPFLLSGKGTSGDSAMLIANPQCPEAAEAYRVIASHADLDGLIYPPGFFASFPEKENALINACAGFVISFQGNACLFDDDIFNGFLQFRTERDAARNFANTGSDEHCLDLTN